MKNFQFSIFNFQKLILIMFVIVLGLFVTQTVHADTVTDNGINFLKSKQDASGRITAGFSAPSQWSAIAITANGVDVSSIKNPSNSLKDFLLTDVPGEPSAATDWEPKILAIVAIGSDPTSFAGINYVQKLEGFYNNNQIGDTCSLNDDIFGLLALIASGTSSNTEIKQNVLSFLISKQDPTDGGFGFSAPGCQFYSASSDMTGAGLSALQAAKDNGLTDSGLDTAILRAKNYLLTNQNSDGGFGYFGSSDPDTTGWVLIGLNAVGMKDSAEVSNARNWLITQQSPNDGGFMICNYDANFNCFERVSNSTTTAQALIGLSGKIWILKVFTPAENPTVTPTMAPTASPSATPAPTVLPTPASNAAAATPVTINNYLTSYYPQYPTPKPDPVIANITRYLPAPNSNESTPTQAPVVPTKKAEVLGKSTTDKKPNEDTNLLLVKNISSATWPLAFVIGLYIVVRFWERRFGK